MIDYIVEERYPKQVELEGEAQITLRPMVSGDHDALLNFFTNIPQSERLFLKHDVTDPAVIKEWCDSLDYNHVLPLLAVDSGKIVANASLIQKRMGWMSHIGDIRIVVDGKYRRMGLARMLTEELIYIGLNAGLNKLDAELMSEQTEAIKTFERLGFVQAAVLPEHVWDQNGDAHDLVIMVNNIRDREYFAVD